MNSQLCKDLGEESSRHTERQGPGKEDSHSGSNGKGGSDNNLRQISVYCVTFLHCLNFLNCVPFLAVHNLI